VTTTDNDAARSATGARLLGIQHAGLTVTDVEASAAWYERVLGLTRQFTETHHKSEQRGYAVVLGGPDVSLNIGFDHHPANSGEAFDPSRTGLDHLCLQVSSVEELHAWADQLHAEGVAHSGV
jgi:glyoxylase I family protein